MTVGTAGTVVDHQVDLALGHFAYAGNVISSCTGFLDHPEGNFATDSLRSFMLTQLIDFGEHNY